MSLFDVTVTSFMAMSNVPHNTGSKTDAAIESVTIQGDGVRLSCHATGARTDPTIVFVHGYPDNHTVWEPVIAELEQDFRCVRYDVRGAGDSSCPRRTSAYRLAHLRADLEAVIDWASPDAPVHLIGHDWGSIQGWEAATDPALASRIASFTSISGPCLDHAGHWLRQQWRQQPAAARSQLGKFWYIFAFHLPVLPQLAWRSILPRLWPRMTTRTEGRPLPASSSLGRDGAHGVKLYRANVMQRLRKPRERHAQAPVQVITPQRDAFVGPDAVDGLEQWVDSLTVTAIDAPHWALVTHPEEIAAHCAGFIRRHTDRATAVSAASSSPIPDADLDKTAQAADQY